MIKEAFSTKTRRGRRHRVEAFFGYMGLLFAAAFTVGPLVDWNLCPAIILGGIALPLVGTIVYMMCSSIAEWVRDG